MLKIIYSLIGVSLIYIPAVFAYQIKFETQCTIKMERAVYFKNGITLEQQELKEMPNALIARIKGHIVDGFIHSTQASDFVIDSLDSVREWSEVSIYNPKKTVSLSLKIQDITNPVILDYDFNVKPDLTSVCDGTRIPHKVGITTPFMAQNYVNEVLWNERSWSFRNVAVQLGANEAEVSSVADVIKNDLIGHSGYSNSTEPSYSLTPVACLPNDQPLLQFSTQIKDRRSASSTSKDREIAYYSTAWCNTKFDLVK